MSKETNERLKLYTSYLQSNPKKFERSIDVSNGYFRSISKGIGADKYLEISRKYPDLNIDWLLTGEGEMLKPSSVSQQQNGESNTQIAGNSNNVNSSATLDKALEEIAEQRKIVATSQEQINRLIAIIEKITSQ